MKTFLAFYQLANSSIEMYEILVLQIFPLKLHRVETNWEKINMDFVSALWVSGKERQSKCNEIRKINAFPMHLKSTWTNGVGAKRTGRGPEPEIPNGKWHWVRAKRCEREVAGVGQYPCRLSCNKRPLCPEQIVGPIKCGEGANLSPPHEKLSGIWKPEERERAPFWPDMCEQVHSGNNCSKMFYWKHKLLIFVLIF